jgi:hypothetical protein
MQDFGYDANKIPLGRLSKRTFKKGYETLQELVSAINNVNSGAVMETLSNQYFSPIPHDFGQDRPRVLHEMSVVQKVNSTSRRHAFGLTENEGDRAPGELDRYAACERNHEVC